MFKCFCCACSLFRSTANSLEPDDKFSLKPITSGVLHHPHHQSFFILRMLLFEFQTRFFHDDTLLLLNNSLLKHLGTLTHVLFWFRWVKGHKAGCRQRCTLTPHDAGCDDVASSVSLRFALRPMSSLVSGLKRKRWRSSSPRSPEESQHSLETTMLLRLLEGIRPLLLMLELNLHVTHSDLCENSSNFTQLNLFSHVCVLSSVWAHFSHKQILLTTFHCKTSPKVKHPL